MYSNAIMNEFYNPANFGVIRGANGVGKVVCEQGNEIIKIFIIGYVKQMPVIETCSFEIFIVYAEAHRLNNVQTCTRCSAGSCNISRILRDFGFNKNNIQFSH